MEIKFVHEDVGILPEPLRARRQLHELDCAEGGGKIDVLIFQTIYYD